MLWSELHRIDTAGLVAGEALEALVLNQRIDDLVKYRRTVEMGTMPTVSGRPGTPYDEAIRREVVLRTDIDRLNRSAKRGGGENKELLKAAIAILTERGTHTNAGAS